MFQRFRTHQLCLKNKLRVMRIWSPAMVNSNDVRVIHVTRIIFALVLVSDVLVTMFSRSFYSLKTCSTFCPQTPNLTTTDTVHKARQQYQVLN